MVVTSGLDQLLFDLEAIFTTFFSKIADVYQLIVTTPLLLIPFGAIMLMFVVKIAKRIV